MVLGAIARLESALAQQQARKGEAWRCCYERISSGWGMTRLTHSKGCGSCRSKRFSGAAGNSNDAKPNAFDRRDLAASPARICEKLESMSLGNIITVVVGKHLHFCLLWFSG